MVSILSEASPSLENILSRHELKLEDLDKECPGSVRDEVAVKLDDWEEVGRYLEFTLEKLRDINRENASQELCKIALLDTWGKREGKRATYLKLASVLHRRQRCDLVEFLCAKLKSTMSLVPLSGSVASCEIASGRDQRLHTQENQGESNAAEIPLDVPKWIEMLEKQFDCLRERVVNELSEGGTSVDQVLQTLTKLPLTFRKEYESTIQNMLPKLEKRRVISKLFHHLNPLFTFIDFGLLQHLISKFGSQELKQEMTTYAEQVQLFKKGTAISEVIHYWPDLKVPHIDHKLLTAKFDGDPKSYTLEKLDTFRHRFYSELQLSEFVSVSILVVLESANSFIAMWSIPAVVVWELMEAFRLMDRSFFQVEQILELSLGERTLYHTESPPQQADASVDALYSLLVSVKSSKDIHEVYIDAHFHYTALKMSRMQCQHEIGGEYAEQYAFKNFRFDSTSSSAPSLRLIVPEENPYITAVEPEHGMIRASDIWRESQHEDLQHHLLDYHLKVTMRGAFSDPLPPIKFEGSTDDSQLDIHFRIDMMTGAMVVEQVQTRRLQDPLSESDTDELTTNKDIQFGYHSASGEHIRITNNGLGAERMNPNNTFNRGVAYGAQPLKGLAEFEVKMVTYRARWSDPISINVGVMRRPKETPIKSDSSIPNESYNAEHHCVWAGQRLSNNLVTPGEESDYGYVDLCDLRGGDCIGLRLSRDGVLEFFVNDESQGIAAKNIYTRDTDIYAVVDHCDNCYATVITKAVTEYGNINLQELCLERLSSWLKSSDQIDKLPLPTTLKDKLKRYFD